jgi:hypothetical protein
VQHGCKLGCGIYFADMAACAATYCDVHWLSANKHGVLVLADVALGDSLELITEEYITALPDGKHSVKGSRGQWSCTVSSVL